MKKKLKALEPTINKNKVKATQKYKDKVKRTKALQFRFNRRKYENNINCWKPYIDYESIVVGAGEKVCFFGGRKNGEVASYDAK